MTTVAPQAQALEDHSGAFKAFILDAGFPCVGAKAAANKKRMEFGLYAALDERASAQALCADLEGFSLHYAVPGRDWVCPFRGATHGG